MTKVYKLIEKSISVQVLMNAVQPQFRQSAALIVWITQ